MNPRTLVVDVAIAVGLFAFVLIVSPGAAVTGMIALIVLVACAISFTIESRARRTRGRRDVRTRPPSRRVAR
ncbi:MAG: hypothetical protein ABSG43_27790 [Solirubrobacteraceae bacterium]|jgi:hypothetical protein